MLSGIKEVKQYIAHTGALNVVIRTLVSDCRAEIVHSFHQAVL